MPIKQIQLRGISRTPSDRATADGGLAEALNVHLDQQETAPTLPPDDITEDIYGEASLKFPIVYIHKMLGTTNYIGHTNGTFRAYGSKLPAEGDGMDLVQVGPGEELQHVSSIGNTLIAYTDKQPYYFLFKDGRYHFLGSQIPRPHIEFISRPSDNQSRTKYLMVGDYEGALRNTDNVQTWNNAKALDDSNHESLLSCMSEIWKAVALMTDNRRQDGVFFAPFFIRYALRLYDGKYIYESDPILCGAGVTEPWLEVKLYEKRDGQEGQGEVLGYAPQITLTNCYKVRAKMDAYNYSGWADLVTSIDIFASTPIYTPAMEASFSEMTTDHYFTFTGMKPDERNRTIKEEVLSKGQFYKIRSIALGADADDVSQFLDGTYKIEASDDISGEKLATHEELKDSYRDSIQYLPVNGTMNINSRILMSGATEVLPTGIDYLNGQMSYRTGSETRENRGYKLVYKIEVPTTGEEKYVTGRESELFNYFRPGYFRTNSDYTLSEQRHGRETAGIEGDWTQYHNALPYAWITYPDRRCTQVEVFHCDMNGDRVGTGKIIPMEPHPYLECACAFIGFGVSLNDVIFNNVVRRNQYQNAPAEHFNMEDNRAIESSNKLFLSEFENPFLFPAGNIITFPDNVVGAASVSTPLSEGQVGDFDLYVFTEGGIRVLSVNNEGTFSGNNVMPTNVSRHVALPGTITPIEQAIIFATEKGVMLLSGSQVTELSRFMNGRPYALEEDAKALIQRSQWAPIVDAIGGGEPFMAFMRNAKAAYDSNGARLIFFNPEKMYQYVYMMETQTWHKILTGVTHPKILNSYPDCLVSFGQHVFNFSTVLDDAELLSDTDNPVYGVIITRPFDLGEPDIRKTITNVRIRGNFNRKDVQYILLGSFDDIHWQRLHSLRGGSYKLFRMIITCRLTAAERITWVDVEYESRFTNKLR